jgi:hypothetical protein
MPFFQNPFYEDFRGSLLLGDRQHIPGFEVKGNAGRGQELVVSWKDGPYNLTGNDADGNAKNILKISFALHNTKNWATISVNVSTGAGNASAVRPEEVVAALNADAVFKERFLASYTSYNDSKTPRIQIKSRKPVTELKFYIVNGQAETVLGFNVRAGVAELPTYFRRHSLANRFKYTDSQGLLVELDPANNIVDADIINNAVDAYGRSLDYNSSIVRADWELLHGKSGLFQFTKGPGTGAVSTTETIIIYHAGAKEGDLAKKIVTQKNAGGTIVAQFEMPHTLTSGDMITPP